MKSIASSNDVAAGYAPLILIAACAALSGCADTGPTFLDPAGPVATSELAHFWTTGGIALIAVLPVLLFLPLIIWRFRSNGGSGRYAPDWDYSRPLEVAMWLVPVAIVAILAVQLVRNTYQLDPYRVIPSEKRPIRIDVIALDWKWLFLYPDQQIATVGEIAIPANVPVEFRMTSDSVMQSFMISPLAGQIYVMPGMITRQNVLASRKTELIGRNTQYNGSGFAKQSFRVRVVSDAEYVAWLERAKRSSQMLDERAYDQLAMRAAQPVRNRAPLPVSAPSTGATFFSSYRPELFELVYQSYLGHSPIQPANQPGAPGFSGRMFGPAGDHGTGGVRR